MDKINQEKQESLEKVEEETTVIESVAEPESEDVETAAETAEEPSEEIAEESGLEKEMASLKEALEKAEQLSAEYLDRWQRSQAALANYRKRVEADRQEWQSKAKADFAQRLLAVLDDFERAFLSMPEVLRHFTWIEGLRLIKRKLTQAMDTEGIKPIEITLEDFFDPYYHQAVLSQEVTGFEEGQIVAEVQKGYLMGERVLRPSLVVIAKAPSKSEEHAPESDTSAPEVESE